MNKAELITKIAEQTNLPKKTVDEVVKATFENITAAMAAGDSFQIVGFGTFAVRTRKAREAINPRDPKGAKLTLPEKRMVSFKAGKGLTEKVNETK